MDVTQIIIFTGLTGLIGFLTWLGCRKSPRGDDSSDRDFFLANGSLKWYYIAGSITLTNLSTDQLVLANGSQQLIVAIWEIAAFFGLLILAFVFIPIYYRNNCTTTTELLQKKYNDKHIRALISFMFLLGNVFIFLPFVLFSGSRFMISMTGVDIPLLVIAVSFAAVGAAYAILGGLRAVAISDTFSGVLILGLAVYITYLSLQATGFDLSSVPAERKTIFGDNDSDVPWHTLLTGMVLIQMFYWSTNQVITQRAMAAPSIKEAQKGVLVAAAIRLLIIPAIIAVPGVAAYALYGVVENEGAYGQLVGNLLPSVLSGAFAAAIAAAVLTTFNSILNASTTMYVCDLHEQYFDEVKNLPRMNTIMTIVLTLLGIVFVPVYASQEGLFNLVQTLYGLLSMPILSAFASCLLFRNVDARAAMIGVLSGVVFYACFTFVWQPFHYIHGMALTFFFSVGVSLLTSWALFGRRPALSIGTAQSAPVT